MRDDANGAARSHRIVMQSIKTNRKNLSDKTGFPLDLSLRTAAIAVLSLRHISFQIVVRLFYKAIFTCGLRRTMIAATCVQTYPKEVICHLSMSIALLKKPSRNFKSA
ncbi:hypothetical protein PXNS11_290050 [Stutzerimonas xanthomarina]|nr:hypothetical protein PXNS11_290050 [Stutzerimonas xanthomarina]